MSVITSKLVKDGNSVAVRLPKAVLIMSELHGTVGLTAKKGQIIVSQAKQARAGWKLQIEKVAANTQSTSNKEFDAWDSALLDGLDD